MFSSFMLLSSVRRRISWNKGYHGYRQDIKGCHRVTFYNNSCSDTDNREELWEAEMEGPPDSLFLLLIFSAPGWCNGDSLIPGIATTLLEAPANWRPQITHSDFRAGVGSTKQARKRLTTIRKPDPWDCWPAGWTVSPGSSDEYVIKFIRCHLQSYKEG